MPLPASLPTIRALKDAAIGGLLFVLTLWLLRPGVEKGSPVIVDDGYYYLQIARNVARGAGSTFDGINATNGYHPLWLLTLVPLYRMIPNDSTGAVHAALVVQALLASGSVFLLYQAARLTMGWSGSIIAVVLWMGISFRMSLSGLEYSLSVFFVAIVAWYYLKRFRSNKPISSKWCYLILGLLLSGAVLSRLDNAFLAMFIGC